MAIRLTLSNRPVVYPHTCDLLDGPGKPHASADDPEAQDEDGEGADSDGGIVERFRIDRGCLRPGDAIDNRDEGDLEHGDGDGRDGPGV